MLGIILFTWSTSTSCELRAASFELRVLGCGLEVAGYELQVVRDKLPFCSGTSEKFVKAFQFLMTWSFQPYDSYRLSGPILDWEIVILILNWIGWGQNWPCWLWPQIAGKLITYFIFQKIPFPEEHLAKSLFTYNKTSKWHFDAHFNNITSKV